MSEQPGLWIEHSGSEMPIGPHILVDVYTRREIEHGHIEEWRPAAEWNWEVDGRGGDIIRYRVRKPKGLTILELIASEPQQRVDA